MTQTSNFPIRTVDITLPENQYYFRIINNAIITSAKAVISAPTGTGTSTGGIGGDLFNPPTAPPTSNSTIITYTGETAKTLRRTYESPKLTYGRYEIRVRKTNSPVDDKHIQDTYLNDVSEILFSKVTLSSLATGWYAIKMTDQLSGIPTITWPVKGVKVDIYDNDGTITATQWSDNPADIVLDMLISERRGALKNKITIDFPAFVKWREYCASEGLSFNGIFDDTQTLWDSMAQVFRVGRAYPVRVGSKLSVAVDKPTQPVMLFGPGNIYKDSFQISYLPLQDRANEFEVSYYDKDDLNKKKTIRITDPTAAQSGEIQKTAQYDLFGIDNFTQAQKEVWYQLYNNRLTRRVITFDAPVEALALTIGDVALVQHDMVNWGEAGRIKTGNSTTNVTLDKKVTIEVGKTYSLLVLQDKLSKITGSIAHITGNSYSLTALNTNVPTEDMLKRLSTNTGDEAAVEDFNYTSSTTATVTLDKQVTGTTFTIWDVDVIEERTVTTGASTTDTLTVSSAFSQIPNSYSNYMFGENTSVKRPYRLRSISGDSLDRRTLVFGEYNELVYSAPETTIPAPTAKPSKRPDHVKNLQFITDLARTADSVVHGALTWTSDNVFRYKGVDIYRSGAAGDFSFYKTVLNTNACQIDVHQGEQIRFKVVAFNENDIRATINTAPIIGYNVVTSTGSTTIPTGGTATTDRIPFLATETISWTRNADATLSSRVQLQLAGEVNWRDYGITQEPHFTFYELPAGSHTARVRSEKGTAIYSDWLSIPFTVSAPTLTAATIANDGTAIDHTINADGSADISFEWSWAGTESSIDGFEVIVYSSSSSAAYTLGTTPSSENVTLLTPNKRAIIFRGVPANLYYTIYVRAFKKLHSSFAANGVLFSTAVKSSNAGENPYRPASSVSFGGDIVGTINVSDINQWSAITGTGKPEDNATFGADWNSNLTNVPSNLAALVGSEAILNQDILDSIADDNILSISEKNSSLKKLYIDLEARYSDLFNRATNLSLSTTALTTARQNWLDLLNSYGKELVTNGTFATDTTGWSNNINDGSVTLSSNAGRLRVTTNMAGVKYGFQRIDGLVIGKTYSIKGDAFGGTGQAVLNIGTTQGNSQIAQISANAGLSASLNTTFVATTSTIYIACWVNTPVATSYAEFDNISLEQVPVTVPWNDTSADTVILSNVFPDNLFPTNWSGFGNITSTSNGAYVTLTDNDSAASAEYRREQAQTGATQYSFGVCVKKDAIPATTRFMCIGIEGPNTGTFIASRVTLDTSTGSFGTASTTALDRGVLDLGDEWFIWVTQNLNSDNGTIRARIWPAWGATSNLNVGNSSTPTGSVDVRSPVLVLGDITNLGRAVLEARLLSYSSAMTSLAKAISEKQPVLRGAWATATAYAVNDVVTYNNTLYICITAHTSSSAPPNANWTKYTPANLDDLNDGSTYGRPFLSRLNAGRPWIDFNEAIHSNKTIDYIGDGATYGRPLLSRLSVGKPLIDFGEAIHLNKNVDNIGDGATYGRPLLTRLSAGKPLIDFSEAIHLNKSQDNIPDGATYVRIPGTNTTGTGTSRRALIDFTQGHTNKNIDNIADGTTYKRITDPEKTALTTALDTTVNIGEVKTLPATDANRVRFSRFEGGTTGWGLYDNTGTSPTLSTSTTLGENIIVVQGTFTANNQEISVGTAGPASTDFRIPVIAGERLYVGAKFGATMPSANVTSRLVVYYYNSAGAVIASDLPATWTGSDASGTTTVRGGFVTVPANTMWVQVRFNAQNGATGITGAYTLRMRDLIVCGAGDSQTVSPNFSPGRGEHMDVVADGTTYARILSSELSSGAHKLTVVGSGTTVGDARNLKPISSAGLRYKFTGTITYTSTTTTATISTSAGSLLLGSQTISYNAMSVNTSGSGTVTYYLYVDTNAYTAGAHTLIATTSTTIPYQGDNRVYIGSASVTYTSGGSGGGDSGGGGGLGCPWAYSFVHTSLGWIEANKVKKGDLVLALSEDRESANDWVEVEENTLFFEHCYTITGQITGIKVTVSDSTPITLRDGSVIAVADINKHELPFESNGKFWWEECEISDAGTLPVCKIKCHQKTYSAGDKIGYGILTHNPKP